MTFELQALIKSEIQAVKANPCDDGGHTGGVQHR